MGRPKEFEYNIVIESATECFWDSGVRGTSISALVAAMKIQRSSFYNSFGSRDEMYERVLDTYLSQSPLEQFLLEEDGNPTDAPDLMLLDLILDYCGFLVHQGHGRGCMFFNGLSELRKEDGKVYECLQDCYVRICDRLSTLLDRIDDNSTQPDPLGRLDLNQLLMVLIGLNHYSKQVQDEDLLVRLGLDQLSALSRHFANLIETKAHVVTQQAPPQPVRLEA